MAVVMSVRASNGMVLSLVDEPKITWARLSITDPGDVLVWSGHEDARVVLKRLWHALQPSILPQAAGAVGRAWMLTVVEPWGGLYLERQGEDAIISAQDLTDSRTLAQLHFSGEALVVWRERLTELMAGYCEGAPQDHA